MNLITITRSIRTNAIATNVRIFRNNAGSTSRHTANKRVSLISQYGIEKLHIVTKTGSAMLDTSSLKGLKAKAIKHRIKKAIALS